uniref:Ig-like domain-containing protein n=1 Tax=Ciona savignyi TaxID=51511 RepID=H2Z2I7_CIOSA
MLSNNLSSNAIRLSDVPPEILTRLGSYLNNEGHNGWNAIVTLLQRSEALSTDEVASFMENPACANSPVLSYLKSSQQTVDYLLSCLRLHQCTSAANSFTKDINRWISETVQPQSFVAPAPPHDPTHYPQMSRQNSFAGGSHSFHSPQQSTMSFTNNLNNPSMPCIPIKCQPKPQTVSAGEELMLNCKADMDPSQVQYQWFKGNQPLLEERNHVLMISDVKLQQQGYYHCCVFSQTNTSFVNRSDEVFVTVVPANVPTSLHASQFTATDKVALLISNEYYENPNH